VTAAVRIVDAVRGVECRPAMAFQNLALAPLVADRDREAGYVVLDDALARGWVTVSEVGEGGHVPELKVVNRGDVAVLLLDGEELVGAKQNRVLNLTILVPPQHTTIIPVSCVESGRWRHVSHQFGAASRTQFAEGRAAKMHQVAIALEAHGTRASDQQAVWSAIAEKSARLGAESDTAAMAAMYEKLDHSLEDFIAAFPPVDRQVGAVFLVNGRLAGLELFDAPSTWRKLSPKLVRSYALDAIDRKQARSGVTAHDGRFLIDAIAASQSSVFSAVGEGEDVRLSGRDLIGAGLVARERAIHLSAFMTVSEA